MWGRVCSLPASAETTSSPGATVWCATDAARRSRFRTRIRGGDPPGGGRGARPTVVPRPLLAGLVALSAIVAPASHSFAQTVEGSYLALRALAARSQVDGVSENVPGRIELRHVKDWVLVAELAWGYGWAKRGLPVRMELQYQHRMRFDLDTRITNGQSVGFENQLRTDSVLLSAVYDLGVGGGLVVYAGGGIGWTRNWSEVDRVPINGGSEEERTDYKDNFSWQLMAGATYPLSRHWTFEIGYRYIDLGAIESGPFSSGTVITADDYTSHDVFFGFVFDF